MNNFTDINNAFDFLSTMPKKIQEQTPNNTTVNPYLVPPSSRCIYCQSDQTASLIQSGQFRRCLNKSCRKDFSVNQHAPRMETNSFANPFFQQQHYQQQTQTSSRHSMPKQKHVNEFIMFRPEDHYINPQNATPQGPQYSTVQDYQATSFSQLDFDPQLKK
jgi:hypothetical protein